MTRNEEAAALQEIQDQFIQHWGEMGTLWGINKAMGQLHALLLTVKEPLCVDQMMERLEMSRGNVSMNIRELQNWGVIHKTFVKGDRKTYYYAEDDMWLILERILKERKKREFEPTADRIDRCLNDLQTFESVDAKIFKDRLTDLKKIVDILDQLTDHLLNSKNTNPLKLVSLIKPILKLRSQRL